LEPILGSGGVIVPPAEDFPALMEIVRRRRLTLIVDEVMTGCGRIGDWTASQAFGLEPDALILAKGLGGGTVPIGTALLSDELADGLEGNFGLSVDWWDRAFGTYRVLPWERPAGRRRLADYLTIRWI